MRAYEEEGHGDPANAIPAFGVVLVLQCEMVGNSTYKRYLLYMKSLNNILDKIYNIT